MKDGVPDCLGGQKPWGLGALGGGDVRVNDGRGSGWHTPVGAAGSPRWDGFVDRSACGETSEGPTVFFDDYGCVLLSTSLGVLVVRTELLGSHLKGKCGERTFKAFKRGEALRRLPSLPLPKGSDEQARVS